MSKLRVGFAMCGSFCTFSQALRQLKRLTEEDVELIPIMSPVACSTDTRFGKAEEIVEQVETLCGRQIIRTIAQAEPIGPKKLLDIIVVAPCTGNTMGKLANGITDTCVTMAVKAHLRNGRPVLLAPATNDALAACGKNIGILLNTRNIFFVPMEQDDPQGKPTSLVCKFDLLIPAMYAALEGEQIQPVIR